MRAGISIAGQMISMNGGGKDMQACVGCGDPVTRADKDTCRECGGPATACQGCLETDGWLTCTRCFDEQAPFRHREHEMKAEPWHSALSHLYHTERQCPGARLMDAGNRRAGTGGKLHCARCKALERRRQRPGTDNPRLQGTAGDLGVERLGRLGIDPPFVAERLGLTPAESRVVVALAEGRSVREIAAALGLKESTVRWFLRQIHRKLDISRQAQLVRAVLMLPRESGDETDADAEASS